MENKPVEEMPSPFPFVLLPLTIIFLLFLQLAKPTPQIKSGTCIQSKDKETWEVTLPCRILQVGKNKYLYECPIASGHTLEDEKTNIENDFEEVKCPIVK